MEVEEEKKFSFRKTVLRDQYVMFILTVFDISNVSKIEAVQI